MAQELLADSKQDRLGRPLAHPRAPAAVIGLGCLLALPSLAVGFCTDDHGFRALLHSKRASAPAFYDLYRFTPTTSAEGHELLVRKALLPWWSAPDFKLHLLRPLSSALFALDDAVFADHAAGYHLHAIAWYAALLAAVAVLYRKVLPGPAGTVSLLVFALKAAHAHAYAWLSARHILVASAFAVLAMAAKAGPRGSTPGRAWIPPLALACGLLGGETALGGVAFLLAYDALGPSPEGRRTLKRQALGSLPIAIVTAAYLVAYRLCGGGAAGGGAYFDPFATPWAFARAAAVRLPVLLGDALLGIPAELTDLVSPRPLVIAGLVAVALLAILYRASASRMSDDERAALRWLVPGALGAALVGVSGFPGGRVLVLPDVGFAALIGALLHACFARNGESPRAAVLGAAGVVLALLHVVLAPLAALRATSHLARLARATERVAREAELAQPEANRAFLIASDPIVFLYPRGVFAEETPGRVRCWSPLSAARAPHRLTRTGPRAFTLEPLGRPLLEGPFERLFRSPDLPFAVGDEFRQCGALIRVAAVTDGEPTRLDIEMLTPIDDDDVTFLVWASGKLRRFEPPPIGQAIEFPWNPGPSRFL